MTELIAVLVPLFFVIGVLLAGAAFVSWTRRTGRPVERPVAPAVEQLPEERTAQPPAQALPYARRHELLTKAERDFFAVLRAAAPEGWYVFPQVRLANLVMLKKGTRNWKPHYSRVAQKCVDFVLCDGDDIGPRLVVELDDSSHDRPDRQARDTFVDAALRAAGLPILHVRWQRHYDSVALAGQIRAAAQLPPIPGFPGAPALTAPHPVAAAERTSRGATRVSQQAAPDSARRWACRCCNAEVSGTAQFCRACGATLEL